MELKKQVCSLELAKRLKELGVKQESAFFWLPFKIKENEYVIAYRNDLSWNLPNGAALNRRIPMVAENFAAFTVAELGEMLPKRYYSYRSLEHSFVCRSHNATGPSENGSIEADARAKMLIYLLENKLIPTEGGNDGSASRVQ